MSLEHEFRAAVAKMDAFTGSMSATDKLRLYGLYKQVTVGDAHGKRPGALDIKGRAKYDAWAECAGMTADAGRRAYIDFAARW